MESSHALNLLKLLQTYNDLQGTLPPELLGEHAKRYPHHQDWMIEDWVDQNHLIVVFSHYQSYDCQACRGAPHGEISETQRRNHTGAQTHLVQTFRHAEQALNIQGLNEGEVRGGSFGSGLSYGHVLTTESRYTIPISELPQELQAERTQILARQIPVSSVVKRLAMLKENLTPSKLDVEGNEIIVEMRDLVAVHQTASASTLCQDRKRYEVSLLTYLGLVGFDKPSKPVWYSLK